MLFRGGLSAGMSPQWPQTTSRLLRPSSLSHLLPRVRGAHLVSRTTPLQMMTVRQNRCREVTAHPVTLKRTLKCFIVFYLYWQLAVKLEINIFGLFPENMTQVSSRAFCPWEEAWHITAVQLMLHYFHTVKEINPLNPSWKICGSFLELTCDSPIQIQGRTLNLCS